MTSNANQLSSQLDAYLSSVAPTYTNTPADGPYNMTYVTGSWKQVTWGTQAHVDYISEMNNRRLGRGGRSRWSWMPECTAPARADRVLGRATALGYAYRNIAALNEVLAHVTPGTGMARRAT